jgi:hypothetical protein
MAARIQVEGLRELQGALRRMDTDLPKQLRIGLNEIATLVADNARPLIPRRTGRAAGSLRAGSSQREARVRAGGGRAPYYPWLDFGGRTGPGRSVRRPFLREGRYVYPTVRKKRDEIMALGGKVLTRVATDAGLEVT